MIIRPNQITKSSPDNSCANKVINGEDEFGKFVRKEKFCITNDKRHFIKSITEYRPNDHFIYKEKTSGIIAPVYGDPDSIYCEERMRGQVCLDSNMNTSTSKDYNLNIPSPGICPSAKSYYSIGNFDFISGPSTFYVDNNVNVVNYDRTMSDVELFSDMINIVDHNENEYQIAFHEFIGLINSFFSLWLWLYPMDAFVVIDCNRCVYNIPKFIIFGGLEESDRNRICAAFTKSVSDLTKLLNHVCLKERKDMLIYAFIGNDCVIKIIDRKRKCEDSNLFTNLDVGNQLMLSSISGSTNFCSGESLGLLSEMNTGSKLSNLIVKDVLANTYLDMCEWTKEYSHFNEIYGG